MKKSTLFTTLALVVIVALALSTATFAWYTAGNESVQATSVSLNAAAPSATDLRIAAEKPANFDAWAGEGYTIEMPDDGNVTLNPVALTADLTTTAPTFASWTVTQSGSETLFVGASEDKGSATPQIYEETFWVANTSTTAVTGIAANVTVDSANSNAKEGALRYLVGIRKNGSGNYTWIGTNATVYYGTAPGANSALDSISGTDAADATTIDIDAQSQYEVTVYAWIDGTDYTVQNYWASEANRDWTLAVVLE